MSSDLLWCLLSHMPTERVRSLMDEFEFPGSEDEWYWDEAITGLIQWCDLQGQYLHLAKRILEYPAEWTNGT